MFYFINASSKNNTNMSDLMVLSVFLTLLCDCQRAHNRRECVGSSQDHSQVW